MSHPLLMVEWVDSASVDTGWIETKRIETDLRIKTIVTVGWLVYEDDDQITMAASRLDADWEQVGEVVSIPNLAVLSRKPLEGG